jgi:pimeloyl-ACP methyl ester carboxylesterase
METLFFRDYGKGFPIVILHGLYGSSDNWIPLAKQLATKFRVIVPDMRNHGRSFWHSDHSVEALAKDVVRIIERENLDQVHLIGHSLGGKVALFLADQFPQYVKKIVVLDISPFKMKNQAIIQAFHEKILTGYQKITRENEIFSRTKLIERMALIFPNDKRLLTFLSKNIRLQKDGSVSLLLGIDSIIKNKNHIFATLDINFKSFQKSILFLFGEQSIYITKQDKQQIEKKFGKKYITIKKTTHWLHIEETIKTYNVIDTFLNGDNTR